MDEPPGSRCFVVCGKYCEHEDLRAAFAPYGCVEGVKLVRDRGGARPRAFRRLPAAAAAPLRRAAGAPGIQALIAARCWPQRRGGQPKKLLPCPAVSIEPGTPGRHAAAPARPPPPAPAASGRGPLRSERRRAPRRRRLTPPPAPPPRV